MPNEEGTLLTNEALANEAEDKSKAADDGKAGEPKGEDGKAKETSEAGDGKAGENANEGNESGDKNPPENETEAEKEVRETKEAADKEAADKEAAEKEAAEKDKAEADKGKGDEKTLTGAPEAYDDFKLPENVELIGDKLKEFQDISKEMDLSQKGAQTLIDKHVAVISEIAEAQNEAWAETRAEWREATKTDKEYGGQKLKANLAFAKAALNAFGNTEFVGLMDDFGLGDHPEVVRFLVNAGKTVSEDSLMSGGTPGSGDSGKSQAERLFPTHASK